uniref:C2 domain-containing protein n=1 Tax=Clytia hemisphaerica TaxID=252671 RepID=A0A7M5UIZ8_9CNID
MECFRKICEFLNITTPDSKKHKIVHNKTIYEKVSTVDTMDKKTENINQQTDEKDSGSSGSIKKKSKTKSFRNFCKMSFGETAKTMAALNKRRKSVLYKRKERTKRECLVEPQNAVDGADEDRAQRLDGAFFEGFVELQEKQKDELEEAAKGTLKREALSSNKYQNDSRSIIKPRSKKQSLDLYKEIMYTIMHRLGARKQGGDNLTDGEIYSYAREVLDISAEEHKQVYDEVKAVKAPECFLNVKVFRAEDVEAKDANGFSDPYCMLCIIKDGEGDKVSDNGNKIKKQVLRHLREENDVKMTKIQMKTLNPEWNQPFKFNVNDLHNQVLRIDMWDKDDNSVILDEENKITSIKGFKGAGRMLKEIYQSAAGGSKNTLDDFLGLVEVPLKNIPENGVDAWFKIESRNNKKTVKGRLRLKISLSTKFDSGEVSLLPDKTNDKEPDRPTSNLSEASANEVYKELLNCCARYDCQQTIDSMQNDSEWQCILSDHAEAILLQYTMQHEIRPLEVAVIKWGIFSKLIQEINIPMDVLSTQMEDFKKHSANDKLDTDYELEQHLESMKIFSDYMIRLIGKYRYTYSNVEQRNVTELGKLLICLLMIHRVPVFTQKYPDLILHKEIEKVLEKSTNEWFFIEEAFHQSMEQDDKDILGYLCHLTNAINADLQRGLEVYEPIFKCINVRYMVVVFNKIETLISQLVEEKTSKIKNNFHQGSKDDVASIWFQLYLAVKGLYQLKKKHIPQGDQNTEGLDNWSSWFRKGVVKLLEIASDKAEARTLKALEMDEVRVIDSMVKHSTSAVDVTCCLGQICIFNNTLEWPDPLGAFTFLA